MDRLKRPQTALFLMIVMIIAGIWIGSWRSLSGIVRQAEAVFTEGENGDGYSIRADLEDSSGIAYNLTLVAGRYLDKTDPLLLAVEDARSALQEAKGPSEAYRANRQLSESVTALYERMKTVELSEKDQKYPQNLYIDYMAKQDIISRNDYNRIAEECNRTLSAFPANILRRLTFVQPVEYFR